jgi:uridylate kinase
MIIVIRIGGSITASPINLKLINGYVDLLKDLERQGNKVVAVVGGGALAREFIRYGEELGLDDDAQDWLAIEVSRLQALLFNLKLDGVKKGNVNASLDEVLETLKKRNIIILGGLKPGMTTDSVAALISKEVDAKLLVKATDQDGIYTKDPREHPDAEKLDVVAFKDLASLLKQDRHEAGIHQILDPVAVKILQKAKIRTVIVNGFKPENVLRAVKGEEIGTRIVG